MILGIGTDIIEISRVKKLLQKRQDCFLKRVYTLEERAYLLNKKDAAAGAAGHFCAKEAVSKAMGTGIGIVRFREIEVYHDSDGAPRIRLHANARRIAGELGCERIHISISHARDYAQAVCILEGKVR